jgi:hypothetical protein
MEKRNKMNECYSCKHRREIPGDAHTRCANPDKEMTGNPHGIKSGWFFYPFNFDPTWKEKDCSNYQSSEVISDAVSQENSAKRPTE